MKKVYLLFTLCMIGYLFGTAQVSLNTPVLKKSKSNLSSLKADPQPSMQRRGGPAGVNHTNYSVWYEDFSTTSNWTFTHNVGTNIDWSIGILPPAGPKMIDEILSPTASNGYAIFDSDLYCDLASGQVAQITMTNPADLTGHSYVRLKFYQYYLRGQDSTFVYVSNNHTTWTKYVVNPKTRLYNYSSISGAINPAAEYIDISSVAANEDSVYVRFEFYSPTSLGQIAGCGFSWMIDDVSIEDIPDADATNDFQSAGEYLSIPYIQPEAFQLRGKIVNKGRQSISGAKIIFNVYDPLLNMFTDSSAASSTINPNDTSPYLATANAYVPLTPGLYQIREITSLPNDSDHTNDTAYAYINVSDSVYTRDYAYWDANSYIGNLTFTGAPFTIGSVFNVYHSSQFTSARIYLSDAKIGDQISMSVYNMLGALPSAVIGSAPTHTIAAADTGGAYVTFVFNPPVNVTPGNYTVTVNELDTNMLTLGFTDLIYTTQKQFYKITNWMLLTAGTPMIRLNNPSSTLVNVENGIMESSYFTVFPNPTKGVINFTNNNGRSEKNMTIEVINSLGATVKKASYNFVSQGRLDVSGLPAGVYTISLSSDSKKEMKTIVLQ